MTTTSYFSPPLGYLNQLNTWSVLQTFSVGIALTAITDPTSPSAGQLWLSTTTSNVLKYADNASTPATHQLGALDIAATWGAVQTYGNNISIGGAQFNISGLVDGHIIAYNGTTGKWTNRATIPATAGVDSVNLLSGVVTLTTPNSTLTISTSGQNVTSDLNLGNPNTWTAAQTFAALGVILKGAGAGIGTLTYANSASSVTLTFPAFTDTLAVLGSAQTFTALQTFGNNISIGGAQFNVSALASGHYIFYNGTNWVNVSPITGSTLSETSGQLSLNLGNANTWTAAQTFPASGIILKGAGTGTGTFTYTNSATSGTITFPAVTDTVAVIGTAQTWTALQTFNSGIQLTAQSLASSTIAGIAGTLVQTTTANARTRFAVAPLGTSNVADFVLFRTSDITTNYEALFLDSEFPAASEFGIGTYSGGTGVIRPLLFFAAPGGVATEAFRMTAGPNLQLARDLLANANNITGVGYFTFNAAIADASAAGKFFLSSTTANTLKYYDTTPTLHQLAVLDLAQTFTGTITLNALTLAAATVTVNQATTFNLPANTASTLLISDGAKNFFTLDDRLTTSGVSNVLIGASSGVTLASAAGLTYNALQVVLGVVTLTGTTTVTNMSGLAANFGGNQITDTSAITVTTASTVYIAGAPTTGGSVTITNAYAFHVNSGLSAFGGALAWIAASTPAAASTGIGSDANAGNFLFNVPTGKYIDLTINGTSMVRFAAAGLTRFNNAATQGLGFGVLFGLDNRTGLTAADGAATTIVASTASGGLYRITADIFATAFTSGTATYTITWTQNGGTRTMVVTATALNTLGTATDLINPDNATAITAQLTGTFTATVTVAGMAEQLK